MLPEKRQGVFSKDEVINFNDCVKGVQKEPLKLLSVKLKMQPKVGKGLVIASPVGLS